MTEYFRLSAKKVHGVCRAMCKNVAQASELKACTFKKILIYIDQESIQRKGISLSSLTFLIHMRKGSEHVI